MIPPAKTIQIYEVKEKLPPKYTPVIISGEIAYWNGEWWCFIDNTVVNKSVTWWTPLISDKDVIC